MKKLLNKKGFTLMEMLIVVAIIVILAAISIPTFSGSLDKANQASDAANLKAAKASFVTQSMLDADDGNYIELDTTVEGAYTGPYYYDFEEGIFKKGDGEAAEKADSLGSCKKHTKEYITIVDSDVTDENTAGDGILDKVQWSDDSTNCDDTAETDGE